MRIGFVNGCYDTFHLGHRHQLLQCASQCDHLVVAINSDDSVRRLKGEGRPADSLDKRIWNVSECLSFCSHAIIPFEGDEGPLLMCIRPQVLFKGYDHKALPFFYRRIGWKKREGPAFEGPEVVQISHLPGFSTTEILRNR